ncbi:MAG TPA: tetratricopeptide repeat protein [Acidobacteriota bacterium]|nr:tetratricopeptide repeat protein [Acidobacteriota bacterium]
MSRRFAGFFLRYLAPSSDMGRESRWRKHLGAADKAEKRRDRRQVEASLLAAHEVSREFGEDDLRYVFSIEQLADYYENASDYIQSEKFYQEAIRRRMEIQGPDHFDLGRTMNDLAVLHYAQGKFEEAVPLYKSVLRIVEKTRGPEDREVPVLLGNLAAVMRKLERDDESDRLLERANAIRRKRKEQKSALAQARAR